MSYKYIFAVVGLASVGAASQAAVIFDQLGATTTLAATSGSAGSAQDFEAANASFSNSAIDDFSTTGAFSLTSAEMGYTASLGTFSPTQVTSWRFDIFSAAAGTTTTTEIGDVASATLAPAAMSFVDDGVWNGATHAFHITVNLASANINLAAGNYWMSLTGTLPFTPSGQIYAIQSSIAAANSTALNARRINPGGGFGPVNSALVTTATPPTGVNIEYRLNGTAITTPEPTTIAAMGLGLVALISRRRRKA